MSKGGNFDFGFVREEDENDGLPKVSNVAMISKR